MILRSLAMRAGLHRCRHYRQIAAAVRGQRGLEVGGPSSVFASRNFIPLYPLAASLKTCNYASRNVWSSQNFDYVHEAADLASIPDGSFDFLLASHILEHVANPFRALHEWRRVLRPGGFLLVLLPFREGTFDHRRPFTAFEHLQEDFERGTGEDDLTHLSEILALHDLARDPLAGTAEQFAARSRKNFENRCLHHHVFDPAQMNEIFRSCGFALEGQSLENRFHIVAFGRRV